MRERALAVALLGAAVAAVAPGGTAPAGTVHVAVAANFTPAMEVLAGAFREATGHRAVISSGSTGQLYAQIRSGAPFGVFLAADARRPRLLERGGLAVAGSRFTYAVGRLALWSADPAREMRDGRAVLAGGGFRRLVIANPATAPYGAAAVQVLRRLGLWARLRDKLVRGENVAQAFHYVRSRSAELGLVALSHLRAAGVPRSRYWRVPAGLHDPVRQQAVLLRGAAAPARSLADFLRGPEARRLIRRFGYRPG